MIEVIRVDGVDYRKVNRDAETGELIVIVDRDECEESYENGAIAEVTYVEPDGDVYAKFDVSEDYFVLRAEYEVLVEAYPQVSRPIEDEISALKAKLDELEARVEAEKKQPEPERLKVGDYAKVINQDGHYQNNTIVEIVRLDWNGKDFIDTRNLDGSDGDIHKEHQLIKVTDEEVAEAKAKLEAEKAKAEEEAKWAKIGRKVGEFKVGDVVSWHSDVYEKDKTRILKERITKFEEPAWKFDNDNWMPERKLTLVAPVESVVNLSV